MNREMGAHLISYVIWGSGPCLHWLEWEGIVVAKLEELLYF